RRHLSVVLPWSCRRLAGRRSRPAGGGAAPPWPERAPDREGDGATRRAVAALARRCRLRALGLLSCDEETRRSAHDQCRRTKIATPQPFVRPIPAFAGTGAATQMIWSRAQAEAWNRRRHGRTRRTAARAARRRGAPARGVPAWLRRGRQRPHRYRPCLAGA